EIHSSRNDSVRNINSVNPGSYYKSHEITPNSLHEFDDIVFLGDLKASIDSTITSSYNMRDKILKLESAIIALSSRDDVSKRELSLLVNKIYMHPKFFPRLADLEG